MTETGTGRTASEENAWQLYQLTMEWVRHGDAKVTALFAANATLIAGVLAMENAQGLDGGWVIFTLAMAVVSLALDAWAIIPNLRTSAPSSSLIYFELAARRSAADYKTGHRELMANPIGLLDDLAGQTHELAKVASSKFKWTGFSVLFLLVAAASAAAMFGAEVIG